jgi:TonB family protein
MKHFFSFKALCGIFLMPISVFAQQTLPPPPPVMVAPPPPPPPPEHNPNREPVQTVFTIVEQMPEYATGHKEMFKYLSSNIKYPKVARENGIEGTVYLGFVVNEDGSLSNITVKRGVSGGCSEEAVRVVQNMPKWNPGKQQGRIVKVNYTLPIKFRLDAHKPEPIYTKIDTMPSYAGGEKEMFQKLQQVKYPLDAVQNKIEGTVSLRFVVNSDGSMSNIEILQSIGGGCDEEAIRVLRTLEKWVPGVKNGKNVSVYCTMPVKFKLN